MAHSHFGLVMGWIGVSLGFISTLVQLRRAYWVSTDGISIVTWFQFILMGFFWISYGIATRSLVIVMGALSVTPVQIAIVAKLQPLSQLRALGRSVVLVGLSGFGLATLFGWSIGVLGIGVAMVFNRLPQIMMLIRHPGDFGVSVGSWTIGAVCSVLWMFYYAGIHRWAPVFATAAAMAGNIVIAVLATWRHRQSRATSRDDRELLSVSVRPLAG